jgi:hypothetical protein
MAEKVVVQRGSQQSNRKQRERMVVLRLFPFPLLFYLGSQPMG